MYSGIWFLVDIVASFISFAVIAVWYVVPRLRTVPRATALLPFTARSYLPHRGADLSGPGGDWCASSPARSCGTRCLWRSACCGARLRGGVRPTPAVAFRTGPGMGFQHRGVCRLTVWLLSGIGVQLSHPSGRASLVHSHLLRSTASGEPCPHLLAPAEILTFFARDSDQ